MIEGYVNYCENTDIWTLVKGDGSRVKINNLVYGIAQYLKEWETVYGEGEYIKVSLEIR